MLNWQKVFLVFFGCLNILALSKGWHESIKKKNPYGKAIYLSWLGIFVWGDAVIFGPFWLLVSLTAFLLKDWQLFLLIVSVFWLVRSVGETIYWLLEQFTSTKRNRPETLFGYRFFKNDSIFFIYQIFWQCITVLSLIVTIYLVHIW